MPLRPSRAPPTNLQIWFVDFQCQNLQILMCLKYPTIQRACSLATQCLECDTWFKSDPAMCAHRSRKHRYIDHLHRYIDTFHCIVCMEYFHNRTHLLNHIKFRSPVCRANLGLRYRDDPLISAAEAETYIANEREAKRALYAKGTRAHRPSSQCFACQVHSPLFCLMPIASTIYLELVTGIMIDSSSSC